MDERPDGMDGMVCRGRTEILKGASETDRRCYLFVIRSFTPSLTHSPTTYPGTCVILGFSWDLVGASKAAAVENKGIDIARGQRLETRIASD